MDYPFMEQVEVTVDKVLKDYGYGNVKELPPEERESVLVARCLKGRLQTARRNQVCPRCWLQETHCYCARCPPVEPWLEGLPKDEFDIGQNRGVETLSTTNIRQRHIQKTKLNLIFLIMHYREIFMGVDTAKLILSTFPRSTRLVVSGLPAKYQESMKELEEVLGEVKLQKVIGSGKHQQSMLSQSRKKVLVLFPDDAAKTFEEIQSEYEALVEDRTTRQCNDHEKSDGSPNIDGTENNGWDIVVIDGTWQQARRMKLRYFPPPSKHSCSARYASYQTTRLSPMALQMLDAESAEGDEGSKVKSGHQLRKHSVPWKKIATFEAVRLFLADILASQYPSEVVNEKIGNRKTIPPWTLVQDYLRIANETALDRKGKTW